MIPGEYLLGEGDIDANVGRKTVQVTVANTGDRPIQVGSHFHFFEANRELRFDRAREVHGLNGLTNGPAGDGTRAAALERAAREGFKGAGPGAAG